MAKNKNKKNIVANAAKNLEAAELENKKHKEAADKKAAELKAQEDKEAADKEAADKEAADKEAADKEAADKEAADKEAADKEAADKEAADKEAADKEAADKEAADKEAADKEAAEENKIIFPTNEEERSEFLERFCENSNCTLLEVGKHFMLINKRNRNILRTPLTIKQICDTIEDIATLGFSANVRKQGFFRRLKLK